MLKIALLIIGGAAGTIARYALSGFIYKACGTNFPHGTLVVNLSGCLIVGILASLSENKFLISPSLRLLLMIGFCGAFTTFSTFILETANLIKDGETIKALANVLLSVIIGFIVFRIGILIGEAI